ncbi:zinc-binding dehydrogenase [Streptomyces sp. MS1.HAVA.3]|uniref:Zinc-binding dehydrogenase n=1 Tax=Streptomyces caledonius TaxID=3134107 RepID=A0ABU8UD67_9ACTN
MSQSGRSSQETMRAMAYETYGGTEVLSEIRLPLPKVGPGEVLVRVKCAAVNPVDWKIMAGGLDGLMDVIYPVIPGWDVSGTVERVGIDVPSTPRATRSWRTPARTTCTAGRSPSSSPCPYAPSRTSPPRSTGPRPRASRSPGSPPTRCSPASAPARTTPCSSTAPPGASAPSPCRSPARWAPVSSAPPPRNHDRVRELGAEPVAYGDGLADRVRALVPDGPTVVADFVGGVGSVTREVLHNDGRHASIADPSVLGSGGEWMWVRPVGSDLAALGKLVDSGQLKVPVARKFPLAELAAAFELSQGGHTAGKIVVEI